MSSQRSIGREIGTALAVLAIYVLTLLAPLHHARASQLGFEELGYSTITASWVTCTPAGLIGADQDNPVSKCPATGVGKTDLVQPTPSVLPAGLTLMALAPIAVPTEPAIIAAAAAPPSGPRAPPVVV
ncbi:hypothetical protein [Devosia sp. A369]